MGPRIAVVAILGVESADLIGLMFVLQRRFIKLIHRWSRYLVRVPISTVDSIDHVRVLIGHNVKRLNFKGLNLL